MRTIVTVLAVLVLFGTSAGVGHATDKQRFDDLMKKYAVDTVGLNNGSVDFRPKVACYCALGGVGPVGVAGFLGRYPGADGRTYLNCFYPTFDAAGTLTSYGYCNVYSVVAK